MNKTLKTILIIVIILAIIGLAIGGYFIWKHNTSYIGNKEAFRIALEDAGLTEAQLTDRDVSFEKTKYSAWYDVEFETHSSEYEYAIDAGTGEILNQYVEPNN